MTLRQSQFVASVPLLIAAELGLVTGRDLEIKKAQGSADQFRAFAAGELDLAVTAMDNLFEWVQEGVDLRLIAQMERTTPLGFYSQPQFGSIAELSGRTFAVDAYANGFSLVARHLFASAGVNVEYIEVGGVRERSEALLSGSVDATLLGAPFDVDAERAGKRLLVNVNHLLPDFPGQGLVVRAELIGTTELAAYLSALQRAVEVGTGMTDGQGAALLERSGFPKEAATRAWASRPRSLTVAPAGLDLLTGIRRGLGLLPPEFTLAAVTDSMLLSAGPA